MPGPPSTTQIRRRIFFTFLETIFVKSVTYISHGNARIGWHFSLFPLIRLLPHLTAKEILNQATHPRKKKEKSCTSFALRVVAETVNNRLVTRSFVFVCFYDNKLPYEYDEENALGVDTLLELRRNEDVGYFRDLAAADLVQLIGYFGDLTCGIG